jgi:predicted nucleic acid-binding protein
LAQPLNADLLILDDKRAQKEADLLTIPYVSSFALLVKTHQKGFVSDLQQALDQLEEQQIFLNKELKDFSTLLK